MEFALEKVRTIVERCVHDRDCSFVEGLQECAALSEEIPIIDDLLDAGTNSPPTTNRKPRPKPLSN